MNSADYSNAVGNNTLYIGVNGGPIPPPFDRSGSANVLDVAATSIVNGSLRTHYFYYLDALYQLDCLCKDFSYYLDDFPPYFLQYSNVTWPPLGTATAVINDLPGWPGGTIPAYERRIAGGKLTLNGTPLPYTNNITFQNYFIGVGNMGNINVSGTVYTSPTNNFSVTQGDTITATAINQTLYNIDYTFSNWSNGSTDITTTFTVTANTTYTANFIGKPNFANRNLTFVGAPGNPRNPPKVQLSWNEHPNDSVKYKIWRKVKHNGVMGSAFLIATVNHGTTTYTDEDYVYTSSYTDDLLLYDVKAYYTIESTSSDDNYISVFGKLDLQPEYNKNKMDDLTIITENTLDNYPNPFNPTTIIQYQIIEGGFVSIKVYDNLGREVAVLVNKEQPSGRYSVTFDASKLSSGVYFYTINAKDFNKVKKMILLR